MWRGRKGGAVSQLPGKAKPYEEKKGKEVF